jgi:hypothetical protein
MRRVSLALVLPALLAALAPGRPARAEEEPLDIVWVRKLSEAFEQAKAEQRPLMIAINSKYVDRGREEPAAKELREKTYYDARVVKSANRFVCAFLTPEGSSDDYGELRVRFGIEGQIVSPQHIFAYPDGTLISRHEYWPYGYGDKAVEAMLDLLEKAWAKNQARQDPSSPETPDGSKPPEGTPPTPAQPETPAPKEGEERAAWIAAELDKAQGADPEVRRGALRRLVRADQDGDCVKPLLALLPDLKKRTEALVDVVRALGRPGLALAADPLADLLDHKEPLVRANAAVSLEYIGDKSSVAPLTRYAQKEDDEAIANHMYRALGRCGAGDAKVRGLLSKKVLGAKSEFASYGPIIGLAYFEKDAKTAREVEKLIQKEGIGGGGRRGGWRGAVKRTLLVWCLTEVGFGDEKAEKFVRDEMIPSVTEGPWAGLILEYYEAAAQCCAGDKEAKDRIQEGVSRAFGRAQDAPLQDDARKDRDDAGFQPKGEFAGTGGP